MTDSKFKYWAFISYSHQDEKWAKWLHKSLETYRIPRHLGTNIKRLFPVFRDREELPASSSLHAKILEALDQSRYLIVICSPYSASSNWVNEEVLVFKQLGRSDRILAVIVDGVPNVTEGISEGHVCFPEALRFELESNGTLGRKRSEPLAADLRPGKDEKFKGYLKLVAAMIGVGFDNLYRRDRKRSLQRMAAAALVIALIISGSIWYWLNYVRANTEYFTGTKRLWGEYVGMLPVDQKATKHRNVTIRTTRKGWKGKLDRIENVNSAGELTLSLSPSANLGVFLPVINKEGVARQIIARIDYERDATGNLISEIGYNAEKSKIYTLSYPPQNNANNITATFTTGTGSAESRGDSKVAQIVFVRVTEGNLAGLDTVIKYADAYGEPKSDNLGSYGLRFEYNEQQLPTKAIFLGKDGQPMLPKGSNFTTTIFKYDAKNQQTSIEMVDESPQAESAERDNVKGVVETYYDEFGNTQKMVNKMTVNGVPIENEMIMHKGVMRESVSTINYPSGKIVSHGFFDEKMQIGLSDEGISSITVTYDSAGKISLVTVQRLSNEKQTVAEVQKMTGKLIPLPPETEIPKMELIPCVVVDEVEAGGIAEMAGLKPGDRIIRYGGKDTPNTETFVQLTASTDNLKEVEIIVVRGIEILKIRLPAGLLGLKVHNN